MCSTTIEYKWKYKFLGASKTLQYKKQILMNVKEYVGHQTF